MDGQDNNRQNDWNGQYSQNQNTYYQDYTNNGQNQNGYNQDPAGNGQNQYGYYQNDYNPYQGQTSYYQQSRPDHSANTLSIVGLIFGILAIPTGCCLWFALLFNLPGIICSALGYKQTRSGVALAGMICSIIGIVLMLVVLSLYYIGLRYMDVYF